MIEQKERCSCCNSRILNYTRFGGGKRYNCCEYNVHFDECEHGDCWCECHKIKDKVKEYEECKQFWFDKYTNLVQQLKGIDLAAFVRLVDIAEGALGSMEWDDQGICERYEKEAFKLDQIIKQLT